MSLLPRPEEHHLVGQLLSMPLLQDVLLRPSHRIRRVIPEKWAPSV